MFTILMAFMTVLITFLVGIVVGLKWEASNDYDEWDRDLIYYEEDYEFECSCDKCSK